MRYGVPPDQINETCTAGAGSLLLEFGVLSRLLGDPVYESAARRTVKTLWQYRSNVTGLLGKGAELNASTTMMCNYGRCHQNIFKLNIFVSPNTRGLNASIKKGNQLFVLGD